MATLYRTHRPQTFADVVGQDHIRSTLQAALAQGRVGHAYLFAGPRGTGKTTMARLLAKAINCQNRESGITNQELGEKGQASIIHHSKFIIQSPEPCNVCQLCLDITEGRALDVLEIDAASNRGIDEIRELRDKIKFAPTQAPKKVFIIDEVHMLTKEAFNALLKTLEEPPAHAIFVLATTELHKVPVTIASRCQVFMFKKATPESLSSRLRAIAEAEGIQIDDGALAIIVRLAGGSYRDAISFLDQIASYSEGMITPAVVQSILGLASEDRLLALFTALSVGSQGQAVAMLQDFEASGIDLDHLTGQLVETGRHLLHQRLGATLAVTTVSGDQAEVWHKLAIQWTEEEIIQLIEGLVQARQVQKYSPIPLLPLEVVVVKTAQGRHTERTANSEQRTGDGTKERKNERTKEPGQEISKQRPHSATASRGKSENSKETHEGHEPVTLEISEEQAPAAKEEVPSEAVSNENYESGIMNQELGEGTQEPGELLEVSRIVPPLQPIPLQRDPAQAVADYPPTLWSDVLKRIKAVNAGLHAILQQAELAGITDGRVLIRVSFQFALDRLKEPKYRGQLETVIAELLGQPHQVVAELTVRAALPVADHTTEHAPEVILAAAEVFGLEESVG